MTALEIIVLMFSVIWTVLAVTICAYFAVVMPLKEEVAELKEKVAKANFQQWQKHPELVGKLPQGVLPSMEDIPENVFNIDTFGTYGDEDNVTPEEAEDQMSELAMAAREANSAWHDLEKEKHGKPTPIFYREPSS